MLDKGKEFIITGHSICHGIAIGHPFFLNREHFTVCEKTLASTLMPREVERYRLALVHCRQDIKRLQKQLEMESASEGIIILEAQLEMLQDPLLTSEIEAAIYKNKKNVEFIFQQSIDKLQIRFSTLKDSFFSDRFKDLQDLSRRIFSYLHESGHACLSEMPFHSIVCSQEIAASDIASAHLCYVSAFVTEQGGGTTHAAIIAKSRGIPYISNVDLKRLKDNAHQLMVVDGCLGHVIVNPSEKTLFDYRLLQQQMDDQTKDLESKTSWPAQTFDGFSIRLHANLDMAPEINRIHELGGEGIGLFRSEYIFLPKNEIPSEDEQVKIYRTIIDQMRQMPVVIRTFDLGGDKLPISILKEGATSFFKTRSTRLLLQEKSLFYSQIRAILRASVSGNVSVLIPMVATLSELREVKAIIQQARDDLQLYHPLRLGCMIEIPSAALVIDHFAKECDFLSIGTNDLIQYALAVDRSDHSLNIYHDHSDPSVIRLISMIVKEANKARIPVSVCGEMASDPRFTALLIGLGIQELSVAPRYLPIVKNAIRSTSIIEAVKLGERVLELKTSQEILEFLKNHYSQNVPDDMHRAPLAESKK